MRSNSQSCTLEFYVTFIETDARCDNGSAAISYLIKLFVALDCTEGLL